MLDMTLRNYLDLVDTFGRVVKVGKAAIPAHVKPILERIKVDADQLTAFVTRVQRFYGTVAGAADLVRCEAQRRKRSRAVSILGS